MKLYMALNDNVHVSGADGSASVFYKPVYKFSKLLLLLLLYCLDTGLTVVTLAEHKPEPNCLILVSMITSYYLYVM